MDKRDLLSYRGLTLEVQQLKEQLKTLEASIYSPKGQQLSATPKVASDAGAAMVGAVSRHIALVKKYATELADKEAKQLAIETAIASLEDPDERVVMRERYIRALLWPDVVRNLQKKGYSERTIYRLHGFALLKLKEVHYDQF